MRGYGDGCKLSILGGLRRLMVAPIQVKILEMSKYMTRRQMATDLNVNINSITRLVNGDWSGVSFDTLCAIAEKLEIDFHFTVSEETTLFKDIRKA